VVAPKDNVNKISNNLKAAGLINLEWAFKLYIWENNLGDKLQAGEYEFNTGMNIKQITVALKEGQVSSGREINFTIIPGQTSRDIAKTLDGLGLFSSAEFFKVVGMPLTPPSPVLGSRESGTQIKQFDFLKDKPTGYGLEGYLFPDTYRVFKTASAEDVVNKILSDGLGNKLTDQMKADIKKQGRTIYKIITMASLVEKEVKTLEDMKIVAGIFWNRIKNNQRLESCASLAYILGVNKPQYTTEDTNIDSVYNTYRHAGLTPGPISNPGLNAIKAAIYPTENNYNFFLSRSDTGGTVFGRTYEEHLNNKAKYLK
jgi:UPF0755 protein